MRKAPTVASARIFTGGVVRALISLITIIVAQSPDADPVLILALVPAVALGLILQQYLIAMLAARYGLRKVSTITATTGLLFCSLIQFFLNSIFIAVLVAYLEARLVYGLYSIGLAMLLQHFRDDEIIAEYAVFVIIFEVANLMGPTIAVVLVDINIRLGLPIVMISMGLFYLAISWCGTT